jgi:hypothetical protein
MSLTLKLALSPLLVAQALRTRSRVPRLPEASGARRGTVGTGALLTILIIAVLGGMRHPIGAFLGAIVFVLLQNFAIDLLGTEYRERFNTVIGLVFLLIVAFSPDGLLGWWTQVRGRLRARPGKVG